VAGDQYDFGVVAKNDVLAADVQVANAESALIVAENQADLSRSRLALRMGYSGDRSVTPAPGPFPVPPEAAPPLSESLRTALEKRNELLAQGAVIRDAEAAVTAARTEFTPTFFGQGGYSYETNDLNPHKSVFSVLLGGKMNLFSGFADEAALRRARLTVDRRKEVLGRLRDEIALEVKASHLFVTEAEKRKAVAEVAVARAEENLRIQNDRYKEGLSISTEVLDAQTLLTRAKVDRQNAAYDLVEARYRLLAARGELLEFLAPLIVAGR
jgi:outer membrane protein TolC